MWNRNRALTSGARLIATCLEDAAAQIKVKPERVGTPQYCACRSPATRCIASVFFLWTPHRRNRRGRSGALPAVVWARLPFFKMLSNS